MAVSTAGVIPHVSVSDPAVPALRNAVHEILQRLNDLLCGEMASYRMSRVSARLTACWNASLNDCSRAHW